MKKPILAMIPSGYKASTLYTPIPIDGDGDFTFTRGTVATRMNKDGLIEEVAANVPRLDYSDSECPTLLLEGSSTNLMTDSADFTVWNDVLVTVDSNVAMAPDGTAEADKVTRTTTSANYISDFFSKATSVTTYTSSVFVKRGNTDELAMRSQGSYPARIDLRYNFATNSIYFVNPLSGFLFVDSKVENYPNDWVRLSWTFTSDAHTLLTAIILSPRLTSGNTDSNDTSTDAFCYLWGGQCEERLSSSSYIETTGTAVTRDTDICLDGGNADLFNYNELSFFIDTNHSEFPLLGDSNITLTDGQSTPVNMIRLSYQTRIDVAVYDAGVGTLFYGIEDGFANQRNKVLLTFDGDTVKIYLNGVLVRTATGVPLTKNLDSLSFSNRTKSSKYFEGKVHGIRVYNEVLTEAEAIELTTI